MSHTIDAGRRLATTPRTLALLSGLVLIGSFVGVLYSIVDVVGAVRWLVPAVVGALALGTVLAHLLSPRRALGLGLGLLVAGAGLYVLLVPEHHDRVLTVGFVVDFAGYLSGVSVLRFLRVDLWAVAVAPGPVFSTWYLLLRRRYDLGTLLGGLCLGFFVLTGDAGWTATLLGSLGSFGVLGFGTLDRLGGSPVGVERIAGVLVGSVLVSRAFRDLEWRGALRSGSGSGAGDGASALDGDVTGSDRRVDAFDHITLSPVVRFTVTADRVAYWHVAAFDRYTGDGWVRSGPSTAYDGPLESPPGESVPLRQVFRVETSSRAMPAAWKPVGVFDETAPRTRVTSTGGLAPEVSLEVGESYSVVSQVLEVDPERLRAAGTAYPRQVAERYLQLPASTPPRLRRKATDIAGEEADPYAAARAIERWLEREKGYSLDVDRPDGDLADAFVFGMERGYCVHFATAMVVLLRTVGVPARLVNGYAPGERVAEDRWVVRGLDSHAWVAVYFPGVGWVPFDPTPAEPRRDAEATRLEVAREEGVPGIDTEETRSSTWTATPDREAAGLHLDPSRSTEDRPTGTPETPVGGDTATGSGEARSSGEGGGPRLRFPAGRVATALDGVDRVTLLATLVGTLLGVHRLRLAERGYRALRLRWQPTTDSPRHDVERAFERLEHLLERQYRPRRPEETPRQYLSALGGPVDRRVERVVRIHERARYAGTVSRERADEAVRLVDELVGE